MHGGPLPSWGNEMVGQLFDLQIQNQNEADADEKILDEIISIWIGDANEVDR